eukprot:CAMPEP_0182417698 /NCGR_PEP_ID=MMETSP1167-20130531/2131_1 /TAXON_ID=2988 /ORGANISM="Mallomonas Sp, Strain CCMP3275" /LENGTH=203 /DNA_ID=CAMNT_0024591415 /DNA_START=58 /DNA_END=669 /DNA_ORIENTATION=-
MFRLATLVASFAGVAAFAPSGRSAPTSALRMAFETELGAQPPIGFWDPLGLLKDADQARFDRLREVEIKHGRVCMLAVLGHITTAAGVRFPAEAGGVSYTDVKAGLAAFDSLPPAGVAQVLMFIGLMEYGFKARKQEIEDASVQYAQYKFKWSDATLEKKKAIELNNGRAAQMGILALMIHEKLNNDPYVINSLLGAPVPFNV